MAWTLISLLIAIPCMQVLVQAESSEAMDQVKFIEESKCLAKEKLSLADVNAFALEDKMELAEQNPKLKCFASCVLEYGAVLDGCKVIYNKNSDSFNGEKKDAFLKLLDSCKGVMNGSDRCECGFQMIKCMTKNEKKA